MRQIALDTETTGLYPDKGDRIIEIAAVEILNRKITQKVFHCYLNPERDVPEEAARIHGITAEQLKSAPLFREKAEEFIQFIHGAELIIHNAAFDVSFLEMELKKIKKESLLTFTPQIIDTLKMAREERPGQSNSLDALCDFYKIDRTKREKHGALIDAELLAEVYLSLTRGQESLNFDVGQEKEIFSAPQENAAFKKGKIIYADSEELKEHEAFLKKMEKANKTPALWQVLWNPRSSRNFF